MSYTQERWMLRIVHVHTGDVVMTKTQNPHYMLDYYCERCAGVSGGYRVTLYNGTGKKVACYTR